MTAPSAAPNQAEELLQAADRAFAAGELRKGYRLVWEAALAVLKPFAKHMGMSCETREQALAFVQDLDRIDEYGGLELYPHNVAAFNVAAMFLEQAEGAYDDEPEFRWEGDQYAFYLPAVKHYVKCLTGKEEQPPLWLLNNTSPPRIG